MATRNDRIRTVGQITNDEIKKWLQDIERVKRHKDIQRKLDLLRNKNIEKWHNTNS